MSSTRSAPDAQVFLKISGMNRKPSALGISICCPAKGARVLILIFFLTLLSAGPIVSQESYSVVITVNDEVHLRLDGEEINAIASYYREGSGWKVGVPLNHLLPPMNGSFKMRVVRGKNHHFFFLEEPDLLTSWMVMRTERGWLLSEPKTGTAIPYPDTIAIEGTPIGGTVVVWLRLPEDSPDIKGKIESFARHKGFDLSVETILNPSKRYQEILLTGRGELPDIIMVTPDDIPRMANHLKEIENTSELRHYGDSFLYRKRQVSLPFLYSTPLLFYDSRFISPPDILTLATFYETIRKSGKPLILEKDDFSFLLALEESYRSPFADSERSAKAILFLQNLKDANLLLISGDGKRHFLNGNGSFYIGDSSSQKLFENRFPSIEWAAFPFNEESQNHLLPVAVPYGWAIAEKNKAPSPQLLSLFSYLCGEELAQRLPIDYGYYPALPRVFPLYDFSGNNGIPISTAPPPGLQEKKVHDQYIILLKDHFPLFLSGVLSLQQFSEDLNYRYQPNDIFINN